MTVAFGRSAPTEGRRIAWAARRTSGSRDTSSAWRIAGAAIAAALVWFVWWAFAASGAWSAIILPTPGRVWDAFVQSVTVHDGRRGLSGRRDNVELRADDDFVATCRRLRAAIIEAHPGASDGL